jgi:hypothetical protein
VCDNRVLRRIFETKGDGIIATSRKLHNRVSHNLCVKPIIIRMRWAGNIAQMREKRTAVREILKKENARNA